MRTIALSFLVVWLVWAVGSASGGTPAPSPAPVPLNRTERAAATTLLEATRELTTVTSVGSSYGEYRARLLDVKIRVDRELRRVPASAAGFRMAIERAMALYVFAGEAWQVKIAGGVYDSRTITESPTLQHCPMLVQIKDEARGGEQYGTYITPERARLDAIIGNIPVIWGCASQHLEEAERWLSSKSKGLR